MNITDSLNSASIYMVCGGIIATVAVICIVFLVRAYRAGIAMGMDKTKLKTVITSSATFSILPSVGILLGVIALSGALGLPWPWLRLSVIGALHYETTVAQGAAEAVGLTELSASQMTAQAFSTIALLMSVCIMWGMVLSVFFNKKYTNRLGNGKTAEDSSKKGGSFADMAMTAMFIGLVSAYIGSYVGGFASLKGLFSFKGDWVPLVVVAVSGATMAFFIWLAEKKQKQWVENFSIALSMFMGMTAAVLVSMI